jgi:mRNA interferase RelE/StbE
MLQIDYSKQSIKILTRLRQSDSKLANRIKDTIEELQQEPISSDTKKLKGYEYYRVRVGNYRIIYHFDDTTIFVTIINKRDVVYKNL